MKAAIRSMALVAVALLLALFQPQFASAADARSVYLWCLAPISVGLIAVAVLKRRAAPAAEPVTVS